MRICNQLAIAQFVVHHADPVSHLVRVVWEYLLLLRKTTIILVDENTHVVTVVIVQVHYRQAVTRNGWLVGVVTHRIERLYVPPCAGKLKDIRLALLAAHCDPLTGRVYGHPSAEILTRHRRWRLDSLLQRPCTAGNGVDVRSPAVGITNIRAAFTNNGLAVAHVEVCPEPLPTGNTRRRGYGGRMRPRSRSEPVNLGVPGVVGEIALAVHAHYQPLAARANARLLCKVILRPSVWQLEVKRLSPHAGNALEYVNPALAVVAVVVGKHRPLARNTLDEKIVGGAQCLAVGPALVEFVTNVGTHEVLARRLVPERHHGRLGVDGDMLTKPVSIRSVVAGANKLLPLDE